jgi:hypothetical protein
MSETTLDTIRTVLESLLEEADDSEVRYKLRTALQLLEVHRNDLTHIDEVADSDEELTERLRELGYLD